MLILACVQVPIRCEKLLQMQQRLEGNRRQFAQAQRRAMRPVEHPRRNTKTVAAISFRKMATKDGLLPASELAAYDELSPEQRVPSILHATTAGFLVSVSPASKWMAATTPPAWERTCAGTASSCAWATACCGWTPSLSAGTCTQQWSRSERRWSSVWKSHPVRLDSTLRRRPEGPTAARGRRWCQAR
jgi:hypothetical protein